MQIFKIFLIIRYWSKKWSNPLLKIFPNKDEAKGRMKNSNFKKFYVFIRNNIFIKKLIEYFHVCK